MKKRLDLTKENINKKWNTTLETFIKGCIMNVGGVTELCFYSNCNIVKNQIASLIKNGANLEDISVAVIKFENTKEDALDVLHKNISVFSPRR